MSDRAGVGMGAGLGIIIGTVVFALTENAAWIGIGIVFGAALGGVFGAAISRGGRANGDGPD